MLDHLSIQCADPQASAAFYDAALASLGGEHVMDFDPIIGYGMPGRPTFGSGHSPAASPIVRSMWRSGPQDRASVRAFFDISVAAGAAVLHEPHVWPEYHPNYYGAFVHDPDGNNVEAVCHLPE